MLERKVAILCHWADTCFCVTSLLVYRRATQIVSRVYHQLSRQPREQYWQQRSGSAVPWTMPAGGRSREHEVDYSPSAARAASVSSRYGQPFGSPKSNRHLTRADVNWLLRAASDNRTGDRGSVKPSSGQGHRSDRQTDSASADDRPSSATAAIRADDDHQQQHLSPPALPPPHATVTEPSEQPADDVADMSNIDDSGYPDDVMQPDAGEPMTEPIATSYAAVSQAVPARPPLVLEDWFLTLTDCASVPKKVASYSAEATSLKKWIYVEGYKVEDGAPTETQWHSTVIAARVGSHTVQTLSGSLYELKGSIDWHRTRQQGLTEATADAFKDGFPEDWIEVLLRDLTHFDERRLALPGSQDVSQPASQQMLEEDVEEQAAVEASTPTKRKSGRNSNAQGSASAKKGASAKKVRIDAHQRVPDDEEMHPERTAEQIMETPARKRASASSSKTNSRASTSRRKSTPSKTPRSTTSSARSSSTKQSRVSRELMNLGKSPFGVVRAVRLAMEAAAITDKDTSATPTEEPDDDIDGPEGTTGSTRDGTGAAESPSRNGATSSPLQPVSSPAGRRSSMRQSRGSGHVDGAKWWIVSPGVIKVEAQEDEGVLGSGSPTKGRGKGGKRLQGQSTGLSGAQQHSKATSDLSDGEEPGGEERAGHGRPEEGDGSSQQMQLPRAVGGRRNAARPAALADSTSPEKRARGVDEADAAGNDGAADSLPEVSQPPKRKGRSSGVNGATTTRTSRRQQQQRTIQMSEDEDEAV